jgi:hypothetical protein
VWEGAFGKLVPVFCQEAEKLRMMVHEETLQQRAGRNSRCRSWWGAWGQRLACVVLSSGAWLR